MGRSFMITEMWLFPCYFEQLRVVLLCATARSVMHVVAIIILSVLVSCPGTGPSPGEIETPGFHRMIA